MDCFQQHSLKQFLSLSPPEQIDLILAACRAQLLTLAKRNNCTDPSAFSATLLFAVRDAQHLLLGHLGDGGIFCADGQGKLCFDSQPDNYNNQSNQTYFTVSPNASEHLRLTVLELDKTPVTNLVMTSDGAYLMFRNRGGGVASATALELMGYAHEKEITTHADLDDVLNQMAEIPSERLDDWSVLLWDLDQPPQEETKPAIVSMLQQELEKDANRRPTASPASPEQPAPERPPESEPAPVRPDPKRPAAAPWTPPPRKASVGTPIPLLNYWEQHQLSETFLRQMVRHLVKELITCEARHIPFPAITPQNIYIVPVNGYGQFRFGRARPNHDSPYIAPEVLQGKRADSVSAIFSLGAVLYALIVGQSPWYYFQRRSTLPFSSDYSREFARIILIAIQPKRQHRYHSLGQMLDDLNHL